MLSNGLDATLEAFKLCQSVWSLILSECPEKEVTEVRRVLGASLIEQASDLREEVTSLLEIWRQVNEDHTTQPSRQLAEPPEVRQRLIQEIAFFVDYLKKKSKGRIIECNRRMVHYVEKETSRSGSSSRCDSGSGSCVSVESGRLSCGSRPRSAVSSQDGRETPLRLSTSGSQDGSQVSVLSEKAECVNAMDIDSVITHLRQALKDECEQHERDIEFLQQCLEQGTDSHEHTEPTIKELRTFGTQLERAVLEERQAPSLPTIMSPSKPTLPPVLPRPPSTLNHSHQSLSRASQVKRKDSRQHNEISLELHANSIASEKGTQKGKQSSRQHMASQIHSNSTVHDKGTHQSEQSSRVCDQLTQIHTNSGTQSHTYPEQCAFYLGCDVTDLKQENVYVHTSHNEVKHLDTKSHTTSPAQSTRTTHDHMYTTPVKGHSKHSSPLLGLKLSQKSSVEQIHS